MANYIEFDRCWNELINCRDLVGDTVASGGYRIDWEDGVSISRDEVEIWIHCYNDISVILDDLIKEHNLDYVSDYEQIIALADELDLIDASWYDTQQATLIPVEKWVSMRFSRRIRNKRG